MSRRIRVDDVAIVLILLQAVSLIVLLNHSYFRADDYWYLSGTIEQSLGQYLFQSYSGHLMPGQFLLVELAQWAAPFHFAVVVAMLVVLQAWASSFVWRLLRALVGASWAALAGLVVFLFAPLAVVSSVWYASALQTIPLQLVTAAVLLHQVRYIRSRQTSAAVWAAVWFVVGLFMWEKSLVILLVVALVTMLWFPDGKGLRGAFLGLWRDRRVWAVFAVSAAIYIPVYLALTTQVEVADAPSSLYGRVVWAALTGGVVPYLLGGPFVDAIGSIDRTPLVRHGVWYLAAFVAGVVATVVRRRSAWRAWCLLAVYLMVDVVAVTASRGGYFGILVGRAPRYFADVTVVAAIALPLALAPLRSPFEHAGDDVSSLPMEPEMNRGRTLAGASVALVYIAASLVTSSYVVRGIPVERIRSFVGAARNDLSALGDVVVYDAPVDPEVMALGSSRQFLLGMDLPVRFGVPTSQLYTLDMDGHLRPSTLGSTTAGKIDEGPCGTRVDNGASVRVDLERPLFEWRWVVRLDYFIGADAAVAVSVADTRHETVVRSSEHQLFVEVTGELDHIDLGLIAGTDPLCLTAVTVGTVSPQPVAAD